MHNVKGVILTGWQRFDHFGVLCELLPVAMPSLVVNLLTMKKGEFSRAIMDEASSSLGCSTSLVSRGGYLETTQWFECTYPGASVYDLIERLRVAKDNMTHLFASSSVIGWLTPYNFKSNYGHIFFAEKNYNKSAVIVDELNSVGKELRTELSKLFFDDTVNEWLYSNIQVHLDKLKEFMNNTKALMKRNSFLSRPLPAIQHLEI